MKALKDYGVKVGANLKNAAFDNEAKKKYEETINTLQKELINANEKMLSVNSLLEENKEVATKNREMEDVNTMLTSST